MPAFTDRARATRVRARRTLRSLTLLAALATPALVQATTNVTAQLAVQGVFAGGTGPLNLLDDDAVLASLSGSATGGAHTFGAGSVSAQHRVIKLQGEFGGSGSLVTRGIFRDGLTVADAGFAQGTPVDVTCAIVVLGNLPVGLGTGLVRPSASTRPRCGWRLDSRHRCTSSWTAWPRRPTTPVPEPGGVALMAAGLALLGWLQRTRSTRTRVR